MTRTSDGVTVQVLASTTSLDLLECAWEYLGAVAHPTLLHRCSGQDLLGVLGSAWECLGVLGSVCRLFVGCRQLVHRVLNYESWYIWMWWECDWECLGVLGSVIGIAPGNVYRLIVTYKCNVYMEAHSIQIWILMCIVVYNINTNTNSNLLCHWNIIHNG